MDKGRMDLIMQTLSSVRHRNLSACWNPSNEDYFFLFCAFLWLFCVFCFFHLNIIFMLWIKTISLHSTKILQHAIHHCIQQKYDNIASFYFWERGGRAAQKLTNVFCSILIIRWPFLTVLGPLGKKLGAQGIEFFIGPGPSQMQRLSLRLAFLTLLGPPEKNWEFRVLNFSLALGLPKSSV